nr:MAG TPA: hypothetical protein [Caudoviricetes sp.]
MMINDEHDEHDEHDDDVMHDMHTNTMHHAWCNAWYKGNTQRTMHKHTKQYKKQKKCYKRNVTKAISQPTMAFKKTMATFRNERKGGPATVGDPLKWDPRHKTRQGTQQNETHTTQFM